MRPRTGRRGFFTLSGPGDEHADGPAVVAVFLRGGADGLSLVPPVGDDDYHRLRSTLRVADALDLDGFFGLHPALGALHRPYRDGAMAVVHAVGTDDRTRSHFEAQDRLEHAAPAGRAEGSGWLARLSRAIDGRSGALSAVAVGRAIPEALRGARSVSVFERAAEHRIGDREDAAFTDALRALYRSGDPLHAAGRAALATLERLRALPSSRRDARYPDDPFGRRLAELARLIRVRVGVRVASVDLDGWDTHFVQADGFDQRARVLGDGLAAFLEDLGDAARRVTVIVMTEFGRRAYENSSLGTDHGRASVMLALGAGVRGGKVYGTWPGLSDAALEAPGDLAVTTDARDVLAELVERRFGDVDREAVIAAPSPRRLGLFDA